MSKQAIIGSIRRGLKRGPLTPDAQAMLLGRMQRHPRHTIPARGELRGGARIAQFVEMVEREYATTARLPDYAAIPAAVADYLRAQNLALDLVVSPHKALEGVEFPSYFTLRRGRAAPTDEAVLTHAFAGVAETGTLMLPSGPETPTLNNLLPDNAIVAVPASRIAGAFEDAFDLLRAERAMPRNVMLVTGPSRSADIEQTLELGAHGPRRLHVLIIDGA